VTPPAAAATLELTAAQRAVAEAVGAGGGHLLVTGRAGTGKSTLLEHIVATEQRKVAVCAPTGVAALNVGGQTIHSLFKLPIGLIGPTPLVQDRALQRLLSAIEVLIGHTSEEARLFLPRSPRLMRLAGVPVVGPAAVRAIDWVVTETVYGRANRRFARRHAKAGGKVHRYIMDWHAPGNIFGAAHTVDLPLLLGNRKTWDGVGLIAGANWEDVDMTGRAVRSLWAGFARGDDLGEAGAVDGALHYRRV